MRRNSRDILSKPGPLDGLTVVEYGLFHAGPGTCAILGDLGARVIKVEAGSGDPMRNWNQVGTKSCTSLNSRSPMFEFSNRNKECIFLDIKSPQGRTVFEKLVHKADIFMTNLRKSTKPKLGIDYETIAKLNPKVVYASVSGFGKEGPAGDDGGYDPLGQARSGMMHLTAGDDPALLQLTILDQAAAIALSQAIMTALYVRERDGIGQEVHVSLYSTALWLMHGNVMLNNFGITATDTKWLRKRNSPLRNNFKCRDGKWIVGTHHPIDKYWPIFCEATGQHELISDIRFKNEASRNQNCEELVEHFDRVFAEKDQQEWLAISAANNLLLSPIQGLEDVIKDPQAIANNYIVDFDHPDYGKLQLPGYPVDFSTFSAGIHSPSPTLGEHTDDILTELGFNDTDIEEMRRNDIVR